MSYSAKAAMTVFPNFFEATGLNMQTVYNRQATSRSKLSA